MSKPVVLASIENADGSRCVDIFARPEGGFGFEEYRRDPEDPRWTQVGAHSGKTFPTREAAEAAAKAAVPWMRG